jgi:hypothetical protein
MEPCELLGSITTGCSCAVAALCCTINAIPVGRSHLLMIPLKVVMSPYNVSTDQPATRIRTLNRSSLVSWNYNRRDQITLLVILQTPRPCFIWHWTTAVCSVLPVLGQACRPSTACATLIRQASWQEVTTGGCQINEWPCIILHMKSSKVEPMKKRKNVGLF